MTEQVTDFGNMASGQLIRASDWNKLVAAIHARDEVLDQRITALGDELRPLIGALNSSLTSLKSDVDALSAEVDDLQAIAEIRNEYYRLEMQTTRTRYALGEAAEIETRVVGLDGNALDPSDRPWVDFFATWGQLEPAPGFETRSTVGNRAISVRTNAEGIAKVLLDTEHAESATASEREQVKGFMRTVVLTHSPALSVIDVVLAAETPQDQDLKIAYNAVSESYRESRSMQKYLDGYYVQSTDKVAGWKELQPSHTWQDYTAMVLVFAKQDSDPRTPDYSRGASSIGVTFRDWVKPWFDHYFDIEEAAPWVEGLVERFEGSMAEKYEDTLFQWSDMVATELRDKGLLGRLQFYEGVQVALDRVPQPPDPGDPVIQHMKDAIALQRAIEVGQQMTGGFAGEHAALNLFKDGAGRAESGIAGVGERVAGMQGMVDEAETRLQERFDVAQQAFAGQVDQASKQFETAVAEAESRFGSKVDQAQRTLGGQIATFQDTVVEMNRGLDDVQVKATELDRQFGAKMPVVESGLGDLRQQVQDVAQDYDRIVNEQLPQLQGDVGILKGRLTQVDKVFLGEGGEMQVLRDSVSTMRSQIGAFEDAEVQPSTIKTGLIQIQDVERRMQDLRKQVDALGGG